MQSTRRTFLMGLGAFAGAQLVLPKLPAIFDMGRAQVAVPTMFDAELLRRMAPTYWRFMDPMTGLALSDWQRNEIASEATVQSTLSQYGQYVKVSDFADPTLDDLLYQKRQFDITLSAFRAQQDELAWAEGTAWQLARAEQRAAPDRLVLPPLLPLAATVDPDERERAPGIASQRGLPSLPQPLLRSLPRPR